MSQMTGMTDCENKNKRLSDRTVSRYKAHMLIRKLKEIVWKWQTLCSAMWGGRFVPTFFIPYDHTWEGLGNQLDIISIVDLRTKLKRELRTYFITFSVRRLDFDFVYYFYRSFYLYCIRQKIKRRFTWVFLISVFFNFSFLLRSFSLFEERPSFLRCQIVLSFFF